MSLNFPYDSGVYIAEDYHLSKRYLSSEEKELLETLSSSSVGDDQRKVLESIIRKFGVPSKK